MIGGKFSIFVVIYLILKLCWRVTELLILAVVRFSYALVILSWNSHLSHFAYPLFLYTRMDFVSLDHKHVMSVARGPLSAALPSFREQAGWAHHHLPAALAPVAAHHSHHSHHSNTTGGSTSGSSSSVSVGGGVGGEHTADYKKHMLRLSAPLPPFERKSIADLFPPL